MKNTALYRLIMMALFIAIMMIMSFTPMGLVPLGVINLTLYCVPVVAGALFMGLRGGLALGFTFGAISTLSAFGIFPNTSALAAQVVSSSPLLAVIMCFVPRLLIPTVAYYINKLLSGKKYALPIAAAAGSLTNTIFYLGLMLLFFYVCGLDSSKVLAVITGTGLLGGSGEAVLNALVVPPIVMALQHVSKKIVRR